MQGRPPEPEIPHVYEGFLKLVPEARGFEMIGQAVQLARTARKALKVARHELVLPDVSLRSLDILLKHDARKGLVRETPVFVVGKARYEYI
jgi:hypothetical protein